jgi:hypothetical protein
VVTFRVAKNRVLAMKRLIAATVALGVLTGPVVAQPAKEDDPIIMDQKQKKKDAEALDRQYKTTLEKTRKETTEPKSDPWSNMRGTDDSKTKR